VYELKIVSSGPFRSSFSRAPNPEGTPLEVARQLFEHNDDHLLPDTTEVVLVDSRRERKPRLRYVKTEVARFTLGDLRTEKLPDKMVPGG
jgi:hypothetical protein